MAQKTNNVNLSLFKGSTISEATISDDSRMLIFNTTTGEILKLHFRGKNIQCFIEKIQRKGG